MSTAFPINDLLRRKLQTSVTVATLTLSIASTVFILLFAERAGFGISSRVGTLTYGLTSVLSQFTLFIDVIIFVIGAVLTSFIVFLMMSQRTRDFGLIKAAGCPNALIAGYFMTELLIITVSGCVLGIIFGYAADYAVANLAFPNITGTPNFLFAPLVAIVYFILALVFGARPILNSTKMSPAKALSPVNYYKITAEKRHKALSRSSVTWKIATRSLFRRQSASIRIVILLSTVFLLLTITIAGGIIASDTTNSWIQGPTDPNTILVTHRSMGDQYKLLLSKFSGAQENAAFNYSDPNLIIPTSVTQQLSGLNGVSTVDQRLVLNEHVQELDNFTIDPETATTFSVGGHREADSIVVGIDSSNLTGFWSLKGNFLTSNSSLEAVIGDSIAKTMYNPDISQKIFFSDPLLQSIKIENRTFRITGVCIDPINNGFITYVPLCRLENTSNLHGPNIVLVKISSVADRALVIADIRSRIQSVDLDLEVFSLTDVVNANLGFLSSNWSIIMIMPLLTLASAALCLVGYSMLAVDEQHQEFAILRAIGTRPRIVIVILAIQGLLVMLSSFGIGLLLGTVITLLILVTNPIVTSLSILEISAWLLAALLAMFLISLYPAIKLARTSILKIIT